MFSVQFKLTLSIISLLSLIAFFIWSIQYSIQLWNQPIPPKALSLWFPNWLLSQEGNITCVYTNLTLSNDISYDNEKLYDLWGIH